MRALILIAAVLAMSSTPAAAQHPVPCGPRGVTIDHLDREYGEVPVAMGQAFNGSMLEVLASPSGSWTIIVTMLNGISCMWASGTGFEITDPVAPPVGDDT